MSNMNKPTPAECDQAISDLMKTGITGVSFQIAVNAIRKQRKTAEKRIK